jgi:pimeloyl-ACP methyl ester carboxylesterase
MQASINGIKLAYDDMGQGPVVVLVHGFPLCRAMWQPQITALIDNGFRIVAPDLRGFGESNAPDGGFSITNCTDDIVGLLKYLGIGRAVLVGTAMSGEILHDMLERYPQRVAATCFLTSALLTEGSLNHSRHLDLVEMVREGHHQTALDGLCQQFLPTRQTTDKDALAQTVRGWMEAADPKALAHALAVQLRKSTRHDSLPGVRHIIKGNGHLLNLEFPGEVNNSLIAFLKSLSLREPGKCSLTGAA